MLVPSLTNTVKAVRPPRWAHELYSHMSQIERLVFAWLALALIGSGLWTIASFVQRHSRLVPQIGGTYVEAAVGQPRYLNPILASANDLDADITKLVYSPLFKFNEKLELVPDLAASYEISADQKIYTVKLRQDVRWHDGEPFTADDVVFTIASIQTPDYGSPSQNAFQGVVVEKQDQTTVVFKLKQPYAPFLASLTGGIAPQHVWVNIAPKNAALAEQELKPIGTGPYKFNVSKTRRKTGEITEIDLVRNDQYYGARPYLDNINFVFYNTQEEALAALLAGNADGIGFVPLNMRDQAANQKGLEIHRLRLPQYYGIFFNQQKNPILADAGIRNALALATDRAALVNDALRGEGEALHLPIPPGVFAFNTSIESSAFNPAKAQQNLEEAGWKAGPDGIRVKDGQRLSLTITTTDWPEYMRTAEIVKQQWQAAGVEVKLENAGAGIIQQTIIGPRNFEALLYGEILPAVPDPYPFWHSSQIKSPGLNFSMLKDERVDKLLVDARLTTDMTQRQAMYEQFQGIILDLKPAIILYRPLYLFATRARVHGITADNVPMPADRFGNIDQWYVNTQRVWGE